MVSAIRKKGRSPAEMSKGMQVRTFYDELIASIADPETAPPSANELFEFMFSTDKVSAQTAEKSENLLTRLLNDHKIWAWTEVESPKVPLKTDGTTKVVGALGVDPENPFSFSVIDLKIVHEKWTSATTVQERIQHPLLPIVRAWYDLAQS